VAAGRTGRELLGIPGIAAVARLRELLAAREYRLASRTVDAVTRTFSRDTITSDQGLLYDQATDDGVGQATPAEPSRNRPSFEVLVVGNVSGEAPTSCAGSYGNAAVPFTVTSPERL
jgi:hypothetical protein